MLDFFSPLFYPSQPRAAIITNRSGSSDSRNTEATSCKTTQGQVGNKRKTFIVLCRKVFYMFGMLCVCFCWSLLLLLLFCVKCCPATSLPSPSSSHNVPYIIARGHIMRHPICMGSQSHYASVICRIKVLHKMQLLPNEWGK